MTVGFFTVFRRDPSHLLHAHGLVASVTVAMPGVRCVQFTDEMTPTVDGVDAVRRLPNGPLLERRLEHYAADLAGDWLLVDTDVQVLSDVRGHVHEHADVALADRCWPGIPQGDDVMHTMPFNTGVVFSRCPAFWQEALAIWRGFPQAERDWMSEQRAVYQTVRTGRYRVQILAGNVYNYPPRSPDDPCTDVAIAHFKGPRKAWLTARITRSWREAVAV